MREFNCTRCGICCANVGRFGIVAWDREGKIRDRGDGVCIQLGPDLLCKIYTSRPLICRVKESTPRWLPLRFSYWLTEMICRAAQKWLA